MLVIESVKRLDLIGTRVEEWAAIPIFLCPYTQILEILSTFQKKLYIIWKVYHRALKIRLEIWRGTILEVATPT